MSDNKQDIKNTTITSKLNKEEQKDPNLENEEETDSNPYYNNNAETIAKIIIEKMISITVTKVHSKETYERIGEHCFNYVKGSVNEILKLNYIPYEIRHNQIEKIFFDRPKCEIHNTWIEIKEPGTPIYDRCTYDQVKINEFIPIEFDVIKSSNLSNNELIAIDKEDKENQNKENVNNQNINNKNKQKEIKENEKKIESRNQSKKVTTTEKNEEKKQQEKPKTGKNGEGPWIDLPSYDLDPKVYLNEYLINDNSEEINELRREINLEIKKKEEQKRIEEEYRRRELNQLQQQNKKQKDFDSKKLTFDSNGNIIKLKPKNNIESNLGNEFYWSKQTMRDVKTFRNQYGRQRNSFSNMKNKKLVDFTEGIPETKKINENENEEDENVDNKKKILRRGSTLVEKKTIKKMREETEIIRNPNNGDPFNNKKNKGQQNKNTEMIIPGGQNFDIIIPEVGVNIITNDKRRRKEGGLNFTEKYKKPSMEEFSKLAFDTENLNTKRFLTGNFSNEKILSSDTNNQQQNNSMNLSINNKDNYIGYSQQFQNDNPLIQNAHSMLNKSDIINQNNISNNQLSISYINQSNKTQLINEIQLSKKMQNSNLKSLFYDNQEINNYKSYDYDYEIKSKRPTGANGFRRKIKSNIFSSLSKDYEITNQKGFDKFNTKIVKNRDWGNNNDAYNEIKTEFIKPHKGNKIRELGYRIVNTKLPRDRKFVMTSQNLPSKKVVFAGLNDSVDKNKEKENELVK